jgi:hypothetical protein
VAIVREEEHWTHEDRRSAGTLSGVSTVEQPSEPTVRFYPPDEALSRARSLPAREHLVIEDVPDDEWAAFLEALAE